MVYYILLPGDTEEDTIYDKNILGEIQFKNFNSNDGWKVLMKLISTNSKMINDIRIIDSIGQKFTIEEFLNTVEKYKFK